MASVPGGAEDSAGCGPEQSDPISRALSRGLDWMTSERPFLPTLFCPSVLFEAFITQRVTLLPF